ncbi:MAG: hypothetical protein RBS88_03680 [Spongiibacteraceae bacterium]|nr:hypothetical protein [Spongiibacteraceae bacterium]
MSLHGAIERFFCSHHRPAGGIGCFLGGGKFTGQSLCQALVQIGQLLLENSDRINALLGGSFRLARHDVSPESGVSKRRSALYKLAFV